MSALPLGCGDVVCFRVRFLHYYLFDFGVVVGLRGSRLDVTRLGVNHARNEYGRDEVNRAVWGFCGPVELE